VEALKLNPNPKILVQLLTLQPTALLELLALAILTPILILSEALVDLAALAAVKVLLAA